MRYLPFIILLLAVIALSVFSGSIEPFVPGSNPNTYTPDTKPMPGSNPDTWSPNVKECPKYPGQFVDGKQSDGKSCPQYPDQFVKDKPYHKPDHKKPDTMRHTLSCQIQPGELKHLDKKCKTCIKDYKEARKAYDKDMSTPLVFKRDGEFYVYIYKNSPYHKEFGYFGKRSYGRDRKLALKLFRENFPNVQPIPDILLYDGNPVESARNCPFIMHDGNPCSSRACRSVDWSQRDLSKQNLSDDCKWNIASYCTQNAGRDPSCACWNTEGEFYNTEYCRKFRKNFETPRDYKCKIDLFEIEEHPDMKNFIRKDRIPCFNCDLDAPATRKPLARRWTSPTH